MKRYLLPLFSLSCALAAMVVLATVPAASQTAAKTKYKAPRTPWGDPDLQGVWPATDMISTPLQRPAQYGDRLYFTEDEYQAKQTALERQQEARENPGAAQGKAVSINPPGYWLDVPKGSKQTSLIVDPPNGKMPALTSAAMEKRAARQKLAARQKASPNETYEDQSLYDRCISRGVMGSILPVIYNNGNEIIQSPGYVTIRNEMIHEARIVPLDGTPAAQPFPPANIRSYMGYSRGHWEGDTLVVVTKNFLGDKNGFVGNGGGDPHSANMVLTERFTRTAPDVVQYEAKIDDPDTFVSPWTVSYPLNHDPEYALFEYACHEGNYAMFNMLSGARADEAKAAAAKEAK